MNYRSFAIGFYLTFFVAYLFYTFKDEKQITVFDVFMAIFFSPFLAVISIPVLIIDTLKLEKYLDIVIYKK